MKASITVNTAGMKDKCLTPDDTAIMWAYPIPAIQMRVHMLAQMKGWYETPDGKPRSITEMLLLCHTEISEAVEEYRAGHAVNQVRFREEDDKPEGFPVELADLVIRVMDLCEYLDIDLSKAIEIKHHFNCTRPHRHGGKLC